MSEQDFNYTLYVSAENEAQHPYELQISTLFSESEYQAGEWSIIQSPQGTTDALVLQLKVLPGTDVEIIHDLNLGILPTYVPEWEIDVEYIDGVTNASLGRKKKNTQQAKIVATPKPLNE
jgi:hypothetical protein